MQKNLIIIFIFLTGLTLLSTGCEPHRIDVQQGNKIKPETLEKIKIGMSRKQVLFVLGTPLLQDPFHQNRWDYIYYMKPGNDPVRRSRVTLYFDGDLLVKIDSSAYTPGAHDDAITIEEDDTNDIFDKPAPVEY